MMHFNRKLLLSLFLLALLGGCTTLPEDDITSGWDAARYYQQAKESLDNNSYEEALNWFSQLEARFPYGRYTQQAQLETIYAHYKLEDGVSAVAAANRFIKLHPRHPNVDYAYYMRGLASALQSRGMIEAVAGVKGETRDPTGLREAFGYFSDLVTRFPDSRYSKEAIGHMTDLRNRLAQFEIMVARQYLQREAYLAVVNRAKYVLENYPRTPAVADALELMVRGYRGLGMDDLAADSLKVLEHNHAGHPAIPELRQQ